MTASRSAETNSKKTPEDASEFEREQLRFFLSQGDVAALLAEFNPSLAWLPVFFEMKLLQGEHQLFAWIDQNMSSIEAIADVSANIRFFGPDTASFIERRLNRASTASAPLLNKCWSLIVQHLRNSVRETDWFEIAPQLKKGEHSPDLLERLANVLRPKLKIGKRFGGWELPADTPSDLMRIEYAVTDSVTADDVLTIWHKDCAPETDKELLTQLTTSLKNALSNATDAGVESETKYSISDSDVPSVAPHSQNEYHSGFQLIVSVIAEIWTRLARKSPLDASAFIEQWFQSNFRLFRRLALFGAADANVSIDLAATSLESTPAGELFLTNSSVEAYRLILARWREFPRVSRDSILSRIYAGPPEDWFREHSEVDRAIDRARFDLLSYMKRSSLDIGANGQQLLAQIQGRWPEWETRPPERAGFHVWHESGSGEPNSREDPFNDISDAILVIKAKDLAKASPFTRDDSWRELSTRDPDRALRGLEAAADRNDWPASYWENLLWARTAYHDGTTERLIAELLLRSTDDFFAKIVDAISSWLTEHTKSLDDALVWAIWDRIFSAPVGETDDRTTRDTLSDSLTSPPGRLVQIVLAKIPPTDRKESPKELVSRLDLLVNLRGRAGILARVQLAADLSFLFERTRNWTIHNLIPLFDWSTPEAAELWSARKYSRYIGSPELFGYLKQSFLEMFGHSDVTSDDLRTFAEWIIVMLIANVEGANYPLSGTEARSALRRAGVDVLSSVGHRLALEMERAKDGEKAEKWRRVVGPVFQKAWPIDVDLQTSQTTFKLVQILRATDEAFSEAADVIVPFIRPEKPNTHTVVYTLANAPDVLYARAPQKMLDLLDAVVGEAPPGSVYRLGEALDRVAAISPTLVETRKFQRLKRFASAQP